MKFVHHAGDYAIKDGVAFFFKNPTEVENRATIERLLKDPSFRSVGDEEKAEAPAEAEVLNEHTCPKCGRSVKQGRFLHVKHCKGK